MWNGVTLAVLDISGKIDSIIEKLYNIHMTGDIILITDL